MILISSTIISAATGTFAGATRNLRRSTVMNNLDDLKEQIQEDIITYLDDWSECIDEINSITRVLSEELCHIVVDRVNELKKEDE